MDAKTMPVLRARVVFEWSYEADPKYYKTGDPNEMCEADIKTAQEDIHLFLDTCQNNCNIIIRPATEEERAEVRI